MRQILACSLLLAAYGILAMAADKDADTPAASATRKKIKLKVSVDFKEVPFTAVMEELHDQADNLSIRPDTKGGVSQNQKITYAGKDKTVAEVLDEICTKYEMGYYVISQQKHAYDGSVWVTRNKGERGYPNGKEPDKTASKDKDPAKDKAVSKDKNGSKDKAPGKDKAEDSPKTEKPVKEAPPEADAQKAERLAGNKLAAIKGVIEDGKVERAVELCEDLIKMFPDTKAAIEAKELLEKLK